LSPGWETIFDCCAMRGAGGKKIPDLVKIDIEKRINGVAEQQ
jgi:hypothetical protein